MEDLIPIFLFAMIALVLCSYFFFRHRARQEVQQTVRIAIERGQELTPEVLEAVSGEVAGGFRDLRRGIIWLALATALGVLSFAVEEPQVLGVAAFPLMLGIAYLALWRLNPGNKR